jgi:SAM-dependent methyltransferase
VSRPDRTLSIVGFYGDQIVPRVTNLLLGSKEFGKVRAEECAGLSGDVVEIGFGSGLNLPHLPPAVTGVWAVDPSGTAMKLAATRIAQSTIPVHRAGLDGAHLDLPDDRFDAALSTMTLCTIPDVEGALDEVRRVLKPGGVLHYAEHGHSPDAKVARTQDRLNGLQNHLAGGCNLNREIDTLITNAGFQIDAQRNFTLKGPKAFGYMYVGTARKP